MFGVDSTELLIIALAALIFIGPKELPTAMRTVGRWVGRARAHARHFTAGIENMMREAELEEMEKRWREENERIMREHPVAVPYAGASESLGSPVPPAVEPVVDDDRQPPTQSLGDEPALPLPEPEHHKRELP
nr:twin-arginine translocase subunit TatB [uncultured Sphingomonas sp.]